MTTPRQRLSRLPSGRRFEAGSPATAPSISGLIAEPRLAPSTSAKAASGETVLLAAKEPASRTMATEECAAQVRPAASITSSTGSVETAPKKDWKLGISS